MPSIPFSSRPSARARHPVAVDVVAAASGGAQPLKLAVKRLPVGRDAGIADKPLFGVSFGHNYGKRNPLISQGL